MSPQRIQRKRERGWRMPEDAVYVGRPARWSNPFTVREFGQIRSVVLFSNALSGYWNPSLFSADEPDDLVGEAYRLHGWMRLTGRHAEVVAADLAGHDLACFCPLDQPCHADVLLELANR